MSREMVVDRGRPAARRDAGVTRRTMLRHAGLVGIGLTSGMLPSWAFAMMQEGEQIIPFTDVTDPFPTSRSDAAEANPGQNTYRMDLRELRSWITPIPQFFAVNHYNWPRVDGAAWQLETRGLVGQPLRLGLDELKRRPRVERTVTFECSGNQARLIHGMVGNATWAGCSLRELLEETRAGSTAKEVVFWAADEGEETIRGDKYRQNFGRSLSLDDAMRSDAILAYEMNGEPLPVVHGFPVRLIVPGFYGISQVKWITGIELSESRLMNRFMGRDYVTVMGRQVGDQVEWVETSVLRQRVKSVVARVSRIGSGAAERTRVFGAAWTDGTPLRQVEVQIDADAWQPATLEAQPQANPFAWTFFTLETGPLARGEHTVVSRATDAQGRVQPASLELKKTYWEDNAQFRRTISVA